MPNPPPTSPTRTRIFSAGRFSTSVQIWSRVLDGVWVLIVTVMRSVAAS